MIAEALEYLWLLVAAILRLFHGTSQWNIR